MKSSFTNSRVTHSDMKIFVMLSLALLALFGNIQSGFAASQTTTTTETTAPPAPAFPNQPAPPPAPATLDSASPASPPPAPMNPGSPAQIAPVMPKPMPGSASVTPSQGQIPVPPAGGAVGSPVELNSPETKSVTTTTTTITEPVVTLPNSVVTPAPKPAAKKKPVKKAKKAPAKKKPAATAKKIPASMMSREAPQELPGIRHSLHSLFPNENVGLETVNNSVAITGTVSDAETAHRIAEVVDQFVNRDGKRSGSEVTRVVNMMQIKTNQQVMLRVRIGEIKRTANKGFGLLTLNDLEKDGLFKVMAEPNLVAISGETANFLSGGEFPVPTSGVDGTTVQYKNYGIGLQFTPIVLSQNRIRLTVSSEVSELSNKGAVKSDGFKIPALSSRKAKTTVELAPGESYMIAGLLKDNMNVKTGNLTGLGDIPVLGALFRDTDTVRDETELVIAVTPYLVDPIKGSEIRLPSDDYHTPNQMETILFGALGSLDDKDKVQLQNPKAAVPDSFGFMTE